MWRRWRKQVEKVASGPSRKACRTPPTIYQLYLSLRLCANHHNDLRTSPSPTSTRLQTDLSRFPQNPRQRSRPSQPINSPHHSIHHGTRRTRLNQSHREQIQNGRTPTPAMVVRAVSKTMPRRKRLQTTHTLGITQPQHANRGRRRSRIH